MSDNQDRVAEIFAEALGKTGTDRREYIDDACGGDERLHACVDTLIAALPDAELFFDSPELNQEMADAATIAIQKDKGRSGQMMGHYRLKKFLGSGGMGEVYSAEDLALGKTVAIKFLRAGVAPHLRARLLKESAASAKIEHPAVATFYEAGNEGDLDYLAMEFVAGETLRDRLRRGPLAADEALALVFALLDGLVHAHAKGIVHRDIKPENIMVTPRGTPKLLDFGIAKEVHLAVSHGEAIRTATMLTSLTGHGFIVGTMGYMSPEQLRGEVISEQTDIFSVGAVLYEVLTGEAVFPGASAREKMAATLSRDVPTLNIPDLHSDVNAILRKALARNPNDRYPNASAFIRDLRDLSSGVSLALLPNTVAIVDLRNLSQQHDDDWIGVGVAESLGADLGRMTGVELVPRNRVLRAAASLSGGAASTDPVTLGLAVGCRWVLTGTYQKMGPRLRLTVRLVEVATSADLWVEKLDGELDNIFEMQDQLARATAESLNLIVPEGEERKQNFSAYELYTKGAKIWASSKAAEMPYVQELFEQAIEIDPHYAPALAGLACICAPSLWAVSGDPALLLRSEKWARKAIAEDPNCSDAYTWLGYSLWRQGQVAAGELALATAENLNVHNVLPPYFKGTLLLEKGDLEAALVSLQASYSLDKQSVFVMVCLGHAHCELGHYKEAEWILSKAVDVEREGSVIQWGGAAQLLCDCLMRQGRFEEAWDICTELLERLQENTHSFRSGWRMFGLRVLAEIALYADDLQAAEVAINQSITMAEAQPDGAAKGHTIVQGLALKSLICSCRSSYDRARDLESSRAGYDFSWGPISSLDRTCLVLAQAALALGETKEAEVYYARARAAGCRRPLG